MTETENLDELFGRCNPSDTCNRKQMLAQVDIAQIHNNL